MIGEILHAVKMELRTFFNQEAYTIIDKKNFSADKWPTYIMPLITLELNPEPDEFMQLIGGWVKEVWSCDLSAYNYSPDTSAADPTDYSDTRINVCEDLFIHFCNYSTFQSVELLAVCAGTGAGAYGAKFALGPVTDADPLEHPSGLVQGYKFRFSITAWEERTKGTELKKPLDKVTQLNPPPSN